MRKTKHRGITKVTTDFMLNLIIMTHILLGAEHEWSSCMLSFCLVAVYRRTMLCMPHTAANILQLGS